MKLLIEHMNTNRFSLLQPLMGVSCPLINEPIGLRSNSIEPLIPLEMGCCKERRKDSNPTEDMEKSFDDGLFEKEVWL